MGGESPPPARECADLCGIKKRASMCAFVRTKKAGCVVRSHSHARPRIVSINSHLEQKRTQKRKDAAMEQKQAKNDQQATNAALAALAAAE